MEIPYSLVIFMSNLLEALRIDNLDNQGHLVYSCLEMFYPVHDNELFLYALLPDNICLIFAP